MFEASGVQKKFDKVMSLMRELHALGLWAGAPGSAGERGQSEIQAKIHVRS